MNYYITSDTHFGHDKLMEYSGRPAGFESLILKRHSENVKNDDIVIHLGDICIGKDEYWNQLYTCGPGRHWLVKGNHDKKTNTWYLSHGWEFACDSFSLRVFGKDVLFSHIPKTDTGYDINIHGHFHNSDHRRHEQDLLAIKNSKHKLIMLEHHYRLQNLRDVVMGGDK